jgi:hypothetical protein
MKRWLHRAVEDALVGASSGWRSPELQILERSAIAQAAIATSEKRSPIAHEKCRSMRRTSAKRHFTVPKTTALATISPRAARRVWAIANIACPFSIDARRAARRAMLDASIERDLS